MKRQLSNAVNRLHARVILLSRGGVRNAEIAQRCGCSPCWVRQIIHRFDEGGIDAITWYPYYCHRAGPRKFLADVTEQIAEVALSPPQQLIGMSVWSLPKLREYLLAQKVVASISIERLRQVLHERKVRWRHTKTWKDSADPQFWPKYRRIRRLYARRPEGRGAGVRRGPPDRTVLHPDRGIVAQPHRVPLRGPAKVRPGQHRLPHPRGPAGGHRQLPRVAQRHA